MVRAFAGDSTMIRLSAISVSSGSCLKRKTAVEPRIVA
jgi:hypothetical protein